MGGGKKICKGVEMDNSECMQWSEDVGDILYVVRVSVAGMCMYMPLCLCLS